MCGYRRPSWSTSWISQIAQEYLLDSQWIFVIEVPMLYIIQCEKKLHHLIQYMFKPPKSALASWLQCKNLNFVKPRIYKQLVDGAVGECIWVRLHGEKPSRKSTSILAVTKKYPKYSLHCRWCVFVAYFFLGPNFYETKPDMERIRACEQPSSQQ